MRSFGCRASARELRPTEGNRVEGATGSCPRDFPTAEGAHKAKERQRTMRTDRSTRTGTGNTTKSQGASPPTPSKKDSWLPDLWNTSPDLRPGALRANAQRLVFGVFAAWVSI